MATKLAREAEIIAEAWRGHIITQATGSDGNVTRYDYTFWPKDTPIDTGNSNSDLSWQLTQRLIVVDEGQAGEEAYYDGIWQGPLFNAFLRWLAANIIYPKCIHSWTFESDTLLRFVELDVSSGYAVDTVKAGELIDGELQVN